MAAGDTKVISVEIPANESLSGAADLGDHEYIAIEMPEAFSGATISFQSKAKLSEPNVNNASLIEQDWDNVFDSAGTEVTMTVGPNRMVVPTAAHQAALAALRYIRVRSGTSAAPTGQNPTRIIRFIVK